MLCNYRTCQLGPVRELVNANWGNVPRQCSMCLIKECGPPNHIWRSHLRAATDVCESRSGRFFPDASHDILDRGRCNSNARELASPTHAPHLATRFSFIRSSRAVLRAAKSF